MLFRVDKGFFRAPVDELEGVVSARFEIRLQNREDWFPVTSSVWHTGQEVRCMIADLEYKLPLHTPAAERNFGALLPIDPNQAEEVRLRLGTPVIDLLKTTLQSLQNEVEAYHRKALSARMKELIRADREAARGILTSEEAFLKAIHEEGLDQKFDFKMNNDYTIEGSIRLNRQEDGSYELYHVGERGVDAREHFQDPFEAFYTTRQWLRMNPLADFSSAKNK